MTYSASPEKPIEFHGVRLTESWNRSEGVRVPVSGEQERRRRARSVALVIRCLGVSQIGEGGRAKGIGNEGG